LSGAANLLPPVCLCGVDRYNCTFSLARCCLNNFVDMPKSVNLKLFDESHMVCKARLLFDIVTENRKSFCLLNTNDLFCNTACPCR